MTRPVRLLYGFLSQSTDPINISIPWANSTQDGMFQMNYSLERAVTQNLTAWARTNRGERLMMFDFGLDAARMLFEPEPIAKEFLLNRARQQLTRYFGFIKIKRLEVLTSSDDEELPENSIKFILEGHFKDDENRRVNISEQIGA